MIKTFDPYPYLTIKTREEGEYSRRAHSHREVSLGYIREGKTLLALGEREFLLRAGDMVLIPAGTVHLCTPEDRRAFRFDMLYLDRGWWERTLGFSPEGFSPLALPAPPSLVGFLDRLLEGAPSPGEAFPGEILARLDYSLDGKGAPADRMEEIHREIRRMPQITLSVEELARRAGLGKFSFIRKYASRYGLTPHADRINMRIQRAILLFPSPSSLAEIGLLCGFSDQSHFINQFRLYTGMTPREYRLALAGEDKKTPLHCFSQSHTI